MSGRVWLIEEGSYSDYHVVGVFSSRQAAEMVLEKIKGYGYDEPEIVEWAMDPGVEEIRAGLRPHHVCMRLDDGFVESANETDWSSYDIGGRVTLWERTKAGAYQGKPGVTDAVTGTVFARDIAHAVKIVNEKRVQILAARPTEQAGEGR